jgi:hypothetical protein
MVEDRTPNIGADPLTQPGHQIKARANGDGGKNHQSQKQDQQVIEDGGIGATEAAVDKQLQALTEAQNGGRCDYQRDGRENDAKAIGFEKI